MMKSRKSLLVIGGLIVLLVASCKQTQELTSREPEPIDYWMLRRSHPQHGFDEQAYLRGVEKVNELKKIKSGGPELNLTWQQEGPFAIGGRVNVLTPNRRGGDTLFCGTANGGVFRSIDAGANWVPVFDDFSYLSIGAIAVDPTDPQKVFVGTGDRNFGGGSYNGNGIYVSTDMGDNWTQTGLSNVGIITSVLIDPQNTNHLLVGALGNGHAKTNDRGVYQSLDGGATWNNTLFVSDSSGVCEMVMDPTNSSVIYACFFNRINLLDRGISRGLDAKIFKSLDGGATWNQLTNGLPNTEHSRVGIAVSESNPNRLYAVYVSDSYNVSDIYLSNDAGASWTGILNGGGGNGLDPNALGGFGWYFGRIYVDPLDENHIILPGVDQYESYDAGQNWALNVPEWWTYEVHADKHALVFQDANTVLIGTDGGMYKTTNSGQTWTPLGELPITQFYRVAANTFDQGQYAGGAQDNGSTSGNNGTLWSRDFGGDGFQMTYVEESDNLVIYETQRGGIHWTSTSWGYEDMSVDPGENTNWDTPYTVFSDQTVMAGTNRLVYKENPPLGAWQPISGDLTLSGLGQAPVNRYHTISEVASSSFDDTQVMAGTSDGLVWVGDRTSQNWTNITGTLPAHYVTSLNFSKRDQNKMYVTMSGYYSGFTTALVFKSEDNGATWTDISNNLPAIGINDMITYDRDGNEFLFVATDAGVFVSEDDGATWNVLGSGMPTVTISALDINFDEQKLVAGTFGRSLWTYDISWTLTNVGLEEAEADIKNWIYPNPVKDYLEVRKGVSTLEILTLDGRLVMSRENVSAGDKIDITSLRNGYYLVRLDGASMKIKVE